jgi:hypothetical protein
MLISLEDSSTEPRLNIESYSPAILLYDLSHQKGSIQQIDEPSGSIYSSEIKEAYQFPNSEVAEKLYGFLCVNSMSGKQNWTESEFTPPRLYR